jgi:S-adenosylmethionine:diacylglycerol 3-amino-3-carboxypropyl transferase
MFSQVREDPNLELFAMTHLPQNSNQLSCLLVGSGGCTLFSMLNDQIHEIEVIDKNIEQLHLISLKLEVICYLKIEEKILDFFEGKLTHEQYDHLFQNIKHHLSSDCQSYWMTHMSFIYQGINQNGTFELLFKELVDSHFDFDTIFNKSNLISKFGKDAVINSSNQSFSDHFRNVVENYNTQYSLEDNYFYHQIIKNSYHQDCLPPYFNNIDNIIKNKHKIKFIHSDFTLYLQTQPDKKYHFIQTSNLFDWMDYKQLDSCLSIIYRCLKKDGTTVMRKLNGNYNLLYLASEYFHLLIDIPKDSSHFYQQVAIGLKK